VSLTEQVRACCARTLFS